MKSFTHSDFMILRISEIFLIGIRCQTKRVKGKVFYEIWQAVSLLCYCGFRIPRNTSKKKCFFTWKYISFKFGLIFKKGYFNK